MSPYHVCCSFFLGGSSLLFISPLPAATITWDDNNTAAGFGSAGETWAQNNTSGGTSAWWKTDFSGVIVASSPGTSFIEIADGGTLLAWTPDPETSAFAALAGLAALGFASKRSRQVRAGSPIAPSGAASA